ncbi:hypothetical protein WL42_13840 [Burkholderia ubonensis]|nr:hypothetical protein WL42_13840 [Burkholderia ubonensis]
MHEPYEYPLLERLADLVASDSVLLLPSRAARHIGCGQVAAHVGQLKRGIMMHTWFDIMLMIAGNRVVAF